MTIDFRLFFDLFSDPGGALGRVCITAFVRTITFELNEL